MNTSPAITRPSNRSRLLMLASAACFITNVLLIRALGSIEQLSLWVVVSARFCVGMLLVLTFYHREFQPGRLFTVPKLVERGLLGGICTLGFYFSVTTLGAGRATFINNTYVMWAGLLAVWALRGHLRPAVLAGAMATILGLGLLTNPFAHSSHTGFHDLIALLTAIGAASGWS